MATKRDLYLKEDSSLISFGNSFIELGFDKIKNFSLISIKDNKRNYQFLHNNNIEKSLFRIALVNNNNVTWYNNNTFSKSFYSFKKQKDSYALIFNFEQLLNLDLIVQIEVLLKKDSNKSIWHFRINNKSNMALYNLTCPIVAGLFKFGNPINDESIAVGRQGEGYLFKYPFQIKDNLPLKMGQYPSDTAIGIGKYHGMYPGSQQMQFILYYNKYSGLYLGTHDKDMNFKSFDLDELPNWQEYPQFKYSNYKNDELPSYKINELEKLNKIPVISISHFPGEKINKNIFIEYDTILSIFHGDWIDGADIYKEWALKQEWCKNKLIDRCNDFIKNGFGMFLFSNFNSYYINNKDHSLAEIGNFIKNLSKEIGKNIICSVFNWEGKGAWSSPKGLFPPREGIDNFNCFINDLRENGNILNVSLPIDEWYLKIPYSPEDESFNCLEEFNNEAKKYAIQHRGGIYIRKLFQGWEQAQICAGTDYFDNFVFNIYKDCIKNGISSVWNGGWPDGGDYSNCYDVNHNHELGYGNWWSLKYKEVLNKINTYFRKIDPNFLNLGEGICDCFIDLLDMYDYRAGMWEVFSHIEEDFPCGIKSIPLFNYIYNEYIGSFSAPWPEINRPEIQYWVRCMGKSLAQGAIPMASLYFKKPSQINKIVFDFYKKITIAATNECWKYIMFGKMLRPLKCEIPKNKFIYMRRGSDQMDSSKVYEIEDNSIEHSAWEDQSGNLGYLFINITLEKVNLKIELPKSDKRDNFRKIKYILNSKLVREEKNIKFPLIKKIEIDPLSILLLEIENI